jgi:hypothetical protein
MGLEAMFFGRHDQPENDRRLALNEEEWIQYPSYETLGKDTKIFMHKLKNSYVDP